MAEASAQTRTRYSLRCSRQTAIGLSAPLSALHLGFCREQDHFREVTGMVGQ